MDFEEGDSIFAKYASLDFIGAEKTKDFPIKPRIIKTHYYYQFTPKNDDAKYIFVGKYFLVNYFYLVFVLILIKTGFGY